ncbi:murein L,D-transpeptidase family protein [Bacteroidota bacterium]
MKPLISTFTFILLLTGCVHSQDSLKNYSVSLSVLIDSLSIPGEGIHIEIDKSDYTLSIMKESMLLKQYPVVFGSDPVKDKLRQGDRRTPEGEFRVRTKYPHRSWDKFIWINYPTEDSWKKHRQAKLDGLIDESDGIGGEIGIHGVPFGSDYMIDVRMNWTLGCISLKNDDINDFYPYIREGTLVIIEK